MFVCHPSLLVASGVDLTLVLQYTQCAVYNINVASRLQNAILKHTALTEPLARKA